MRCPRIMKLGRPTICVYPMYIANTIGLANGSRCRIARFPFSLGKPHQLPSYTFISEDALDDLSL